MSDPRCGNCRHWIPRDKLGLCNVLYVVTSYRDGGTKGAVIHERSCSFLMDVEPLRCAGHFSCSAFKDRNELTDADLWGEVA